MKESLNEQISALADGELGADESRFALKRLQADADLRQAWSRTHLVRDCLRRERDLAPAPAAFAAGVIARIDSAETAPRTGVHPWLRNAAGGLIAAGVAAAALFAVAPSAPVAPSPETAIASAAPAPEPAIVSTPVTTDDLRLPIGAVPASDSIVTPLRPVSAMVHDPRLDQYLIQHSDATLTGARGGYVPYVYIVASPPNRGVRPPLKAAPDAR